MPGLVGYLLLFLVVGVGFILVHLLAGKLIRPAKPSAEKLTVYECGEPTIGSAWIQFDLRFYVVALLFVIFDVEVAFFFPWAVVFGQSNNLAHVAVPQNDLEREAYIQQLDTLVPRSMQSPGQRGLPAVAAKAKEGDSKAADQFNAQVKADIDAASSNGWLAFWDILVFFGVLLVGFAYLWVRGDLQWVRSTAAERLAMRQPAVTPGGAQTLAGVGSGS